MKQVMCLLAFLLTVVYINAEPANAEPFIVMQPNGDTITIRLVGDEYGSWYETFDGYIIDKGADGYWRYASNVINNKIQCADIVTNQTDELAKKAINQQQVRECLSLSRRETKSKLLQLQNDKGGRSC